MRHTPGPWRVSSKSKYLVRTDDFRVCQVFKSTSTVPKRPRILVAESHILLFLLSDFLEEKFIFVLIIRKARDVSFVEREESCLSID